MRENPWHLRIPTTEHYQWFKNLVDLHEITTTWLKEIQAERPSYLLTRGFSKKVSENLWILDSLAKRSLEDFLNDSLPEEFLTQLEHTVWVVQAWTLSHVQGKASPNNRTAIETVLEQLCWNLGTANQATRWGKSSSAHPVEIRNILLSLNDSPFAGYPRGSGFLVKRAVPEEIQIELRSCPHQIPFQEVKSVADRLCRLHANWMRGFGYGLNHRILMEHVVQAPRCIQRWIFI